MELMSPAEFLSWFSDSRELIGDNLEKVEHNCVFVALKSYKERHEKDKSPLIAQMGIKVPEGVKFIPHYYYRSDNWIEQRFLLPGDNLNAYVGPAKEADPIFYGNFEEYKGIMSFLPEKLDSLLDYFIQNGLDKAIF